MECLSVSLTQEELKLACLRPGAMPEVLHLARMDLKETPDETIANLLRSSLQGFTLKRMLTMCAIPASAVTTKNIEIPSRDPQEIKSIINLQAGRHTPYSREEILIGFINIGVYQVNYTKVLLAIVNRQLIKKHLKILEMAGLRVEKVLFAPEGLAHFYSRALSLKKDDRPVGVIDITRRFTDFSVVLHGTPIACRSIPIGLYHLHLSPMEFQTKLLAELKKSVESYQNEDIDKLPETYLLTSEKGKVGELANLLATELHAQVMMEPYANRMKASAAAQKVLSEEEDSFLSVIGTALVAGEAQIDLMPEETKLQRSIQTQGYEVVKLGILTLVLLLLICLGFFSQIYFKNTYLSRLTTGYSEEHQQVETLEEISARTRIVKDYMNSRMTVLAVIRELYRLTPQEIYLENIALDEKGSLSIKGISESMSRVFALVTALEESGLFKGVKTQSTTAKKERGKDVAAFEITFKLESAKDEPAVPVGEKGGKNPAKEKGAEKPKS